MRYLELSPPSPLDQLVKCFWFLSGEPDGSEPEPVVPDGRMELILHLAQPFGLLGGSGPAEPQQPLLIAGQLTRPIRLVPLGRSDVVGMRLRTVGAASLIGGSLGELANRVESLFDVAPDLARALQDAVVGRNGSASVVDSLSRALAASVKAEPSPLLRAAVCQMRGSTVLLATVAASIGVSPRTLERRFRHEVGLSPKVLSRVLRFRGAFRALEQTGSGRWARIAMEHGYYDQAHLIREFRRLAGMTPSRFFGNRHRLARAFLATGASRG